MLKMIVNCPYFIWPNNYYNIVDLFFTWPYNTFFGFSSQFTGYFFFFLIAGFSQTLRPLNIRVHVGWGPGLLLFSIFIHPFDEVIQSHGLKCYHYTDLSQIYVSSSFSMNSDFLFYLLTRHLTWMIKVSQTSVSKNWTPKSPSFLHKMFFSHSLS